MRKPIYHLPLLAALLLLIALHHCGALAQALPPAENTVITVPGAGRFGTELEMQTLVYRPPGAGPFPVLLFSHGRAGDAVTRGKLKHPVSDGQVRYWLGKGFAVVAPIRPGYGATGGPDGENSGAHFDGFGTCTSKPDYRRAIAAGEAAVLAAMTWVRQQPWADDHRIVLEGQSVGGLLTVATAATQPQGVIGYVNFAGGLAGDPELAPGHSCDPGQLGAIYAELGKTSTLPGLWVYAQNDQYWGPNAPVTWHEGFAAAGGGPSRFFHAPAVADGDGHGLSRHAPELWAPLLDEFLDSIGFSAKPSPDARQDRP